MTINDFFLYLILALFSLSIVLSLLFWRLHLKFSKSDTPSKKLLLSRSLSAWGLLVTLVLAIGTTSYYHLLYQYKKSDIPLSYLTKSKNGFPEDKYVATDMPNIPNTTPYGMVVIYDKSEASQRAVKEVKKEFYDSGDIPKNYLLSDGFTPAVSFISSNSDLGKLYKSNVGKNTSEIVTTHKEGKEKGFADKVQQTELTAPSIIFYTNTGKLVSATKVTDVKGKYHKVVIQNAKSIYKEVLQANNNLKSQQTTQQQSSSEEKTK